MRRTAPYPRDRAISRLIEPSELLKVLALGLVTLATITIYALAPV